MDRGRQRPFLNPLPLLAASGIALLSFVGNLPAQAVTPGPSPSVPAASATPWVQASPPPGLATAAPKPPKPPASPTATPPLDEVAREMMQRRRAEEQRAQTADKLAQQAARDGKKGDAALSQLPPEERAAFQRNLLLWRQLPPEERDDLKRQANERMRQETDRAYQESGLNLDPDQREVFDLRYKQERRKVERDLQQKADAERARRLVEVNERLKREFAGKSAAPQNTVTPMPKKAPSPTPMPTANPDASGTLPFMR